MEVQNRKSKNYQTAFRRRVKAAFGLVTVAACLLPMKVIAQEVPDALEEIVVTGSILRRTDTAPSPVTIMTDEYLEQRGINTVSEAMQRMSANNAGTIVNNWNVGFNFASGATAPALRGLTVQSTLSMADGLRLAPYPLADDGQRNFVDLNTIPSAIVERIEVLRDGASSTYGADAIAGVVNVITKKEVQGFHLGGSTGFSADGGGEEQRIDATWGHGDIAVDGHNFYISAEYQLMESLRASERGGPFNTADWSNVCGASGSCLTNNNWNGVTAEDGTFNGFISVPGVTMVRPVAAGATTGAGQFEYLNPAAGCLNWPEVSVTPAQSGTSPAINCEVDFRNAYYQLQPEIERTGLTFRYTANISENSQFYAMANFYKTDTQASTTPLGFRGTPATPRPAGLPQYRVLLPAYVCSTGVGTFSGENTGCDATNGQLNPNNPYAAQGLRAQVELRSPRGRAIDTSSQVQRVAFGLEGTFGDDWRYTSNFTQSEVSLTRTSSNYLIPQRIMDVAAQGTFDFSDPAGNSEAIWNFISPSRTVTSPSRLWQVQGNVARDLMELPGGPLQLAVGASYREESIDAPSANAANNSAPYERYYSINAVGTAGSRSVTSMFFEVDAPVAEILDIVASGRFDDYSSGQSNFSPKIGFKLSPSDSVALRSTWSQGFRIPSFNEAFGLPTTGFVTRQVDCVTFADFCNAHGGNAYATTSYSLGLTTTGEPGLDPEESESFTVGVLWNAMDNLTVTLDYWQIEVDGLITGVTNTTAAEEQYYSNNGVVNLPGIAVVPGSADTAFPNALPLLGFIESSFQNQDSQEVSGFDINVTLSDIPLGRVDWTTSLDVSFLQKYELTTDAGQVLVYDGTLSPCNITSCSGAPEVRGSWQNTVYFTDKTMASLTLYYTSGLDTASIDFGGVAGDCQGNADNFASTIPYVDGTPSVCNSEDQWNADLVVSHQLNDNVRLFADVLNVFDIDPEFDPSAAYGLYGFNPSWAGPNIMGRYIRIGAELDFE
ncbi:MAG: TonB-dependent receptor [Gammaproteobacteria bacterium]|nr:TonB-dependent receptor [Gammaproteobacteria bacterium]